MSGYSGNADTTYTVDRYKVINSDDLITENDMEDNVKYEYVSVLLTISGSSYFTPGRYSGPPDKCYPDEGETEITSVVDSKGNDWMDQITESEKETFKELIIEAVQESDNDDCDGDSDDYDDPSVDYIYDP